MREQAGHSLLGRALAVTSTRWPCRAWPHETFGVVLLAAIPGYVVGLFGTMAAIELFSPNQHDKWVEAAMTGAFVVAPLTAGVAVIVILSIRRTQSS